MKKYVVLKTNEGMTEFDFTRTFSSKEQAREYIQLDATVPERIDELAKDCFCFLNDENIYTWYSIIEFDSKYINFITFDTWPGIDFTVDQYDTVAEAIDNFYHSFECIEDNFHSFPS